MRAEESVTVDPVSLVTRSATRLRLPAAWCHLWRRGSAWLALLLSATITALVYGPALRFSFFIDDALDLGRAADASAWALLRRPPPNYPYYRPLPFLLWKGTAQLFGRFDPAVLHLLPLVAQALAGWLLFLLLRRLTGSDWSVVPMVLFLLYPFSYQAVEDLGALFHPLVTAEIFAVLLLWYDGRVGRSPWRLAVATVVAIAALLTHEFAAVLAPLVLALEGMLWWQRWVTRPTWWLLGPILAESGYLVLWFHLPKAPQDRVAGFDLVHNAGFWLQGFAYPVVRQAAWLVPADTAAHPLRIVFGSGLVGLIAGLLAFGLRHRLRLGLIAIAVGFLAFLPVLVALPYSVYVQGGPRLLEVVAPASAAFWGLLPLLGWRGRRRTVLWRVATLALVALVAFQSLAFIARRTAMFDQATAVTSGIIAAGGAHDGGSLLVLNTPAWFALDRYAYPLGDLGIEIVPGYVGLDQVIRIGVGAQVQVASRSLAPDVAGWRYRFQPHGPPIDHGQIDARLRAGATLVVVDSLPDRMLVRVPGTLRPNQPAPATHLATFGDGLDLLKTSVRRHGNLATITTDWYVTRPLIADAMLWTQLRTTTGTVVAERKDYALRGMSPPRLWRPGDLIEDRLVLELPRSEASMPVDARIALVSTAAGALLPIQVAGRHLSPGWWQLGVLR